MKKIGLLLNLDYQTYERFGTCSSTSRTLIMEQPSTSGARSEQFLRNVYLLKNGDFEVINGQIHMPSNGEISTIRRNKPEQYKRDVEFNARMSSDMVKTKLEETFPYLKNKGFCCAAKRIVDNDKAWLDFDGSPRRWNGRTISKNIQGNSALYILENDQMDTSSGISASDSESSQGLDNSLEDTGVNPGNNSICQTREQINPMPNTHVLLDGQPTLFSETADSNTGIAQIPLVTETEMEVDDSKQGNDDELDMYGNPTSSVNQVISDSTKDDNLLSYVDSLELTSGTNSDTGFGCSPDDFDCFLSQQWTTGFVPLEVESVSPNKVPLKGVDWCRFKFNQTLPCNVQSGIAMFEGLGNVDMIKGGDDSLFGKVPSAQRPGWVTVTLVSKFFTLLGETKILYVDEEKDPVQQVLNEPRLLSNLFRELAERKVKITNEGETQDSGNLDFTNPVHVLCLFIYKAAESGAQQFIEMIFNSSAGRIVFDSYKDRPLLPEAIAKSHGNEETAHYLEDITERFSEETTTGKECPQTIDWSELVNAAKAAEKRLDVTSQKENVQIQKGIPKETGYLGDIDTSSSESSEAQSSDSDDDISRTSRKGIQMDAEESKQPIWQHGDDTIEAIKESLTQSPKLFLKNGVITDLKIKTLKWKENGLHLIQASRFQDVFNVREVKYLQGSDISFLLGLGNEPVQHHLTTAYQRLGFLLALSTERNACYQVHVDTAEDHQSLERLSITVGNVADCKASRLDVLQQLCCRLINGVPEFQNDCFPEFTATANREDLTVRRKSAECLMEHCQSTAGDFWVLTYIFRPTRKMLFVYVADSEDVYPFASCFDDQQYELSWQLQQWQRCKNNVPKVREIGKLSEFKNLQLDPSLLNPQVTLTRVTKVVCKEQCHTEDEQAFDVVGKPCFKDLSSDHKSKNFERDWNKALYSSPSQNKIAHQTESKDELFLNSHQHKGAQKINNDIDVLVSESWPAFLQVPSVDEVGDSLTYTETNSFAGIAKTSALESLGDLPLCYDCVTELSNSKRFSSDCWVAYLGDSVAKNTSLPTLSLTINGSELHMSEDWTKGLGDVLAKNTSFATLSLTINSRQFGMSEDWAKGLGDVLAKNTSLTTLSLTINCSNLYMSENWGKDIGDGLVKNSSLTTLSLIINSSNLFMSEDWAKGLGDGLAKNTSLTTLSLTMNSSNLYMSENWGKGLGDGLVKNSSLTTLSLIINSSNLFMSEDWAKGLGDGLAKNTSLTTLSLTMNSSNLYMSENWGKDLGDGLVKNSSLTTLSLIINSSNLSMSEDWAKGLGDGLAKNTSITTLSLTINGSEFYRAEDGAKGLGDSLAKNTSLTTLNRCISEDWARQIGDGLAKGLGKRFANRTLSKKSPSFLVTLCNDCQLLDHSRRRRAADFEERSFVSLAHDPFEFEEH